MAENTPVYRYDYDDAVLRGILEATKTIAMVGATPKGERRAAFRVMRFLQAQGYKVHAVNPRYAGQTVHDEPILASLHDVPEPVDLVDLFWRADGVGAFVDDAIAIGAPAIWMQLEIFDDDAAARATAAGATVVMDRCTSREYRRLLAPALT